LGITVGGTTIDARLNLDSGELNTLQNGFSQIVIGRGNSSGAIALTGNVTFNDPVLLRSPFGSGSINTTSGTLGGADNATITLLANQAITTGNIINPGAAIAITSTNGSIDTGTLDTSSTTGNGGAIAITAAGNITTRQINSSGGSSRGGNVTLNSSGDIQVNWINAEGGTEGGSVDIRTQRFFRATEAFSAANSQDSSISTAGGAGGGDITIRHGGNGVTPFNVGNATTNGTAGAITSGDFTIAPSQSFPFTYTEGNIQIIGVDLPINPVDLGKQPEPSSPPNFQQSTPNETKTDVVQQEEIFTGEFKNYLGENDTPTPRITLEQIQSTLSKIEQATGAKPALIYAVFVPKTASPSLAADGFKSLPQETPELPQDECQCNSQGLIWSSPSAPSPNQQTQETDELELVLVTSEGRPIRKRVPNADRNQVEPAAEKFWSELKYGSKVGKEAYKKQAQQFYQWLITPLEDALQKQGIKNLVFVMDDKLRSLPLATLHDGKGFVIEKYSVGLMPSMSLTDTRYINIRNLPVLAMGASEFPGSGLNDLPLVPKEVEEIIQLRGGISLLNADFTTGSLQSQRRQERFSVVHLATHGRFNPGQPSNSFIEFRNERLTFDKVRQLRLNKPQVELLVLSACETALGDRDAELGFAGFAHLAGVKSVLASLWLVSDEGTLELMTEFYQQLQKAPIKAEALRQAQLAMLKGEFSHPHYWSGFTMIGNPW